MEMWEFLSENNPLHLIIKRFEENFPHEFLKTDINKCGNCKGEGLEIENKQIACKTCCGIGYVGFTSIAGRTICVRCNSTGKYINDIWVSTCSVCKGTGLLDWVDAIKTGIKVEGIL